MEQAEQLSSSPHPPPPAFVVRKHSITLFTLNSVMLLLTLNIVMPQSDWKATVSGLTLLLWLLSTKLNTARHNLSLVSHSRHLIPIDLFTLYDRLLGLKCVLVLIFIAPCDNGAMSQGFFTFQVERPVSTPIEASGHDCINQCIHSFVRIGLHQR